MYAHGEDDAKLKRYISIYERVGGIVHLVHLVPSHDTLLERVTGHSRKAYLKIKTKQKIRTVVAEYDMYTSYPKHPSLRIDNSKLTVARTVKQIIEKYHL